MSEEQITEQQNETESVSEETTPVEDRTDEETQTEETKEEDKTDQSSEESPPEEKVESDKEILKVYGQEVAVDKNQLRELAMKGLGADEKFRNADSKNKQLLEVIEDMKTRPFEILKNLGVDVRKMTEDYLIKELDKEQMSEEQRKVLEYEAKMKAMEDERNREKEEKEQKELAADVEKYREEYEKEFIQALDEEEIPNNPQTVGRMARYIEEGIKENITITAKQSAKLVKEDLIEEAKQVYSKTDPEKLINYLGPEIVKKLKNYDLSKIKSPEDKSVINKSVKAAPKTRVERGKTANQLKSELDKLYGGDPHEYNPELDGNLIE